MCVCVVREVNPKHRVVGKTLRTECVCAKLYIYLRRYAVYRHTRSIVRDVPPKESHNTRRSPPLPPRLRLPAEIRDTIFWGQCARRERARYDTHTRVCRVCVYLCLDRDTLGCRRRVATSSRVCGCMLLSVAGGGGRCDNSNVKRARRKTRGSVGRGVAAL